MNLDQSFKIYMFNSHDKCKNNWNVNFNHKNQIFTLKFEFSFDFFKTWAIFNCEGVQKIIETSLIENWINMGWEKMKNLPGMYELKAKQRYQFRQYKCRIKLRSGKHIFSPATKDLQIAMSHQKFGYEKCKRSCPQHLTMNSLKSRPVKKW